MIVERVKENLNVHIVDNIYGQERLPATYEEWKQSAIRWDNREQTKRLARSYTAPYRSPSPSPFIQAARSPSPSPFNRSPTYGPRPPTPGPARAPSPTPFRSPSPVRVSRAILPDTEYKRRKEAGECFGCGKKWTPGHRCDDKAQRIRAVVQALDEEDKAALMDTLQLDFRNGRE